MTMPSAPSLLCCTTRMTVCSNGGPRNAAVAIKSWPAAEVRPDTSGEVGSAACSAVADTAIATAATNPRMETRGNTSYPTAQ